MIELLRTLLSWNTSVRDPLVLLLVLPLTLGLAFALAQKPGWYLPLILVTDPLPKLFTVNQFEVTTGVQASPGFSVVDLVLAAGMAALLFRHAGRRTSAPDNGFGRALLIWGGSIVLSTLVGLVFWAGVYSPVNSLYSFRYVLTIASYGVAVRYAISNSSEPSVRRLLRLLTVAGNVTIALGIAYYFLLGGAPVSGGKNDLLTYGDSVVTRSYLYFFDYGNDMGYFTVLIAILNLIQMADRRTVGLRLISGFGVLCCVLANLLIGERAEVLVLAVSVTYFLVETADLRHRSVGVSAVFRVGATIAVFGACLLILNVFAPEAISRKLEGSVGNTYETDAIEIMERAGVPQSVVSTVASLPIGDFANRLALNISSLWYFLHHPAGVGFWGELDAAGWWAHHEIIKIAVEQGILGLMAFTFLMLALQRLLWSGRHLPGARGQLGVLLRSISVGLFVALVMANAVILDMKFALTYWSLLGLWSVFPRTSASRFVPVVVREPVTVNA